MTLSHAAGRTFISKPIELVFFIICWFQEEELNNNRGEDRVRSHHAHPGPGKRAGRTGWPQHVWALELKPWSVTQSRELLTGPTQPRFIYKEILRYDKVASDTVAPCQLASQILTSWLRRRQLGGTLMPAAAPRQRDMMRRWEQWDIITRAVTRLCLPPWVGNSQLTMFFLSMIHF